MTSILPRTIALDGPVASGKSSVGRRVAEALGFLFFDTGVLYRALAVVADAAGVPVDAGDGLAALVRAHDIAVVPRTGDPLGYAVTVDGADVTPRLWAPAVDAAASAVSAHGPVRAALLDPQRGIAAAGPVVMVGRDVGTVVLPEADLKIYLAASPEARARRRFRERIARGEAAVYTDILSALRARDADDAGRAVAPLKAARDAVVVDTEACDLDAVVSHLIALVRRWPDELTTRGGTAPCLPRGFGDTS